MNVKTFADDSIGSLLVLAGKDTKEKTSFVVYVADFWKLMDTDVPVVELRLDLRVILDAGRNHNASEVLDYDKLFRARKLEYYRTNYANY